MASIREYFDKAAERVLTAIRNASVEFPGGKLEITIQIHYDFEVPARYLSLFIPPFEHYRELCKHLFGDVNFLLRPKGDVNIQLPLAASISGGFAIFNNQPDGYAQIDATPLCEPQISGASLPFSGTIIIYSENEISEVDLALLQDVAKQKRLNLRWRGVAFARERSLIERPVAFISHDSRDKADIARPLAIRLQRMPCPVWFDEFALRAGDSLREQIEKGLKETARCIVILSPNFLANRRWTKVEFDSVFTREIIEERNVFLPVWHNVSVRDVYEYSPALANRLGIDWSLGVDEVAARLYRKISEENLLPRAPIQRKRG